MQNNKLQKIFFRTFLITLICVVFVVGIGIAAFALIDNMFGEETEPKPVSSALELNIITDITLGTPSFELIYGADKDDTKITKMVLAIFNTETHNLDYVTIPVNTEHTLSQELHSHLKKENETIPQTIKLADMPNYFNGKETYEYGELIVGDMLGVKMSYYTKILDTEFENYFVESQMNYYQPKKATFSDTLVYSNAFITSFANVKKETVINFLTDFCNNTTSNLTMKNRTNYSKDYAQVDYNKIYYWHLYGDIAATGDKFTPNADANNKLIERILSNKTYTITQAEYEQSQKKASGANSKNLNAQILNGAGIKRLAGKWQDKLVAQGYKIGGVGDYSGEKLTSTKIIVKNEGIGLDLVKYFKNATVETGTVPEGYNIVIVVGSEDDFVE